MGRRESGRAGERESGRVGERESGRAGEWESGRAGERDNLTLISDIVIFQKNIDGESQKVAFYTKTSVCYQNQSVDSLLQQCRTKVLCSMEEFESKGNLQI